MAPASVKICDVIAPSIAPMNETRQGVLPVVIEKSNRFAMMSAVAEIRLDRLVVKTSNVIVLSECDFDRDCADGQRCENRQCEVCECEPAGQNQEVCGSDGQTYNSPCLARCARIDVVANGAREPVVECPPEDDSCAFVCRGLRPPLPEGCIATTIVPLSRTVMCQYGNRVQ